MTNYYTQIPVVDIGGGIYSKVYILKNNYKCIEELFEELKSLFDNTTIFVAKETIWIVRSIFCAKTLENKGKIGDASIVIHNGEILRGKEICEKCNQMVQKIIGECKKELFIPENKNKTFFIRNKFLNKYEEIPSTDALKYVIWDKKMKNKNKDFREFIKALRSTSGKKTAKDIKLKNPEEVFINKEIKH
jgi:hypothetical protein